MDAKTKKYGIMLGLFSAGVLIGYMVWKPKTTTTTAMSARGCTTCGNTGLVQID